MNERIRIRPVLGDPLLDMPGVGPVRIIECEPPPGETGTWVRIISAAEAPGEAERQERIDWLHRRLLRLRAEADGEYP